MYKEVKFSDIAGYEYQKIEAKKIANFLKNYDEFVSKGAFLPKGAIFFGPPGTGKTLFANAIANEAGVKTFNISNEEFYKATNTSEKIKQVFSDAKASAPCIIFIDEIDTIIPNKQGPNSQNAVENLRVLLTSIDDIQKTGVMVIATANTILYNLPPSLVRNGRIEKHICVGSPDLNDRIEILKYYFNKTKGFDKIKPELVASYTNGLTCSSLESLVNDVLINSITNNKQIEFKDFIEPINVIKNKSIKTKTPKNNEYVIIHEVGHFIVDYVLRGSIGMLTSIPYGSSAGSYSTVEDDEVDVDFLTYEDLVKECTVSIAGLAATEVYLGKKYIGAISDLNGIERAYDHAIDNGLLGLDLCAMHGETNYFSHDRRALTTRIDENTRSVVRRKEFLNSIYESATNIIKDNKELCDMIIKKLKKEQILLKEDIKKIINNYKKKCTNK